MINKFNCVHENNTITITPNNIKLPSDTDCLVVPGRIWNSENKNVHTITTSNHGYEIFIINYPQPNILEVNKITPNFFTIINTENMSSDGTIKFKENSNDNKNLRFINILDLNENVNGFKNNINNNLCHDPDDNRPSKFNFEYKKNVFQRELTYTGNPRIYIIGDYEACTLSKYKDTKNVFIYFDYGKSKENVAKCLGKMKLYTIQGYNKKDQLIHRIIENHNGFQYKINNTINNLQISFDPRNNISLNGFSNFIIIDKIDDISIKKITFDNKIITNLEKQNKCLNVRFWLASLYFSSDKKIIDSTRINGPYNMINFSNSPKKVLIFIPPYKLDNTVLISSNEINIKQAIFNNKNFQTNYNICDIYINIIY